MSSPLDGVKIEGLPVRLQKIIAYTLGCSYASAATNDSPEIDTGMGLMAADIFYLIGLAILALQKDEVQS